MPEQGQMALAKISLTSKKCNASMKSAGPPTWALRRSFQRLSVSRSSSNVGKINKGLDEGPKRGWSIVSMKDDWNRIYAETVK